MIYFIPKINQKMMEYILNIVIVIIKKNILQLWKKIFSILLEEGRESYLVLHGNFTNIQKDTEG